MNKLDFHIGDNGENGISQMLEGEFSQPKARRSKALLNYAGIFIGVFLVFVVVVVMTTDIHIVSFSDIAGLGLTFFVLVFCAYSMFICCADSGRRSGESTEIYTKALERFNEIRGRIITGGLQGVVKDFCCSYIESELESSRKAVLMGSGVTYDEYMGKYLTMSKRAIRKEKTLSRAQRHAIVAATSIKPLKLTAVMLLGSGSDRVHRRSPISVSPARHRREGFIRKLFQSAFTSLLTGSIVLEATAAFSRSDFAVVCLKLLTVVTNGFTGYKFGYENVTVDAVSYLNDRSDLLEEAISKVTEAN